MLVKLLCNHVVNITTIYFNCNIKVILRFGSLQMLLLSQILGRIIRTGFVNRFNQKNDSFTNRTSLNKSLLNETHSEPGVTTNPPTRYRFVKTVVMALLHT